MVMLTQTRKCCFCYEIKSIEMFYTKGNNRTDSNCKICVSKIKAKYYSKKAKLRSGTTMTGRSSKTRFTATLKGTLSKNTIKTVAAILGDSIQELINAGHLRRLIPGESSP